MLLLPLVFYVDHVWWHKPTLHCYSSALQLALINYKPTNNMLE